MLLKTEPYFAYANADSFAYGAGMSALDLEYYKRRLEDERTMARSSVTADVAALHEELARLYEKMINVLEAPPEAA